MTGHKMNMGVRIPVLELEKGGAVRRKHPIRQQFVRLSAGME